MKRVALGVCLFLTAVCCGRGYTQEEFTWGFTSMWESQYNSEGRNNLEDGGAFNWDLSGNWGGFTGGVWYLAGDSDDYEEFNAYLEYGFEIEEFEAYLGYTWLHFREGHESSDDHEIGAGVAYTGKSPFIPAIDYVYSAEAEGGFLELSLRCELCCMEERLIFTPYVLQAFDFGYATPRHDGANHFQLGLEICYAITEWLELHGHAAHAHAQEDIDREELGNETWGGVGVTILF